MRNAVAVCIDTVRYDTFELVGDGPDEVGDGSDEAPSPTWRRALRFDRAQAPAPWTLPSLASAFTGLYPNRHGAGSFADPVAHLGRQWPARLPEALLTLPERLGAGGFATAAFVAHPWFDRRYGLAQGFDVMRVEPGGSGRLVEEAARWLDELARQGGESRFFLYLHFMEAHGTTADATERSRRIAELPDALRSRALAHAPAGACEDPDAGLCAEYLDYVDRVRVVRRSFERLFAILEARGLLESTVIALFSDHGSEFLEHAEVQRRHAVDPRGRYGRHHGHALYQEQLHVPLLFWHPALAGRRSSAPASLVDVAPTLLDWLGLELPGEAQGRSLAAVLDGQDFDPERPLYSSGIAYGPEREAVVKGARKRVSAAGGAPALLFDLAADPGEREPRAAPARDLDLLLGHYRRARARPGEPVAVSRERLAELQALGYLDQIAPDGDADPEAGSEQAQLPGP